MTAFPDFFEHWKRTLEVLPQRGRRFLRNRARRPDGRYVLPYKPEEIVRQGFVSYLLDEVGVPPDSLEIEPALGSRALSDSERRRRCDLLVHGPGDPILIVEFKREDSGESLIAAGYAQARLYAHELRCCWVMVCNGQQAILFNFDNGQLTRVQEDLPPALMALRVSEKLISREEPPLFDASHFDTSRSQEQPWAIEHLVALQNFILSKSLVGHSTKEFVIRDLGCESAHFGNAGGHKTKGVRGIFRFYEVALEDRVPLPVGISIVKYDDPAPGYRSKNILTVSCGRKSSLEMSTYTLVWRDGDRLLFRHKGGLRPGHKALRASARSSPELTDEKPEIVFGSVPMNQPPDRVDWTPLVLKILRYAVQRESIKRCVRTGDAQCSART